MRLWHKDLIPYLPRQQLLGQWRECCAIAKSIAEKGTPNHILVNKIMDYPLDHFVTYAELIDVELCNRGYMANSERFYGWIAATDYVPLSLNNNKLFADWHNDRYLRQCYYNLQEKYDCGGISAEEWAKIEDRFIGEVIR